MTKPPPLQEATISEIEFTGPFDFRWPAGVEHFESGWTFQLVIGAEVHEVKHGIGVRDVYGRDRVHTVTWLNGHVQVEGVEADDYPGSGSLLSLLRQPDKRLVKELHDVSADYEGFDVVDHRTEIDAKWSRDCLAVKLVEDDLVAWGVHAWIRSRERVASSRREPRRAYLTQQSIAPAPPIEKLAVADALISHGAKLAAALGGGVARLAADDDANAFVHNDAFAFLVAVIADQGIRAERAWAIPHQLRLRLGGFSPELIAAEPLKVREAFAEPTDLHRFNNKVSDWTIRAAGIVIDTYGGDAAEIWAGVPTAAALRQRFEDFPGIGQKKAAMAVEILVRDLGVQVDDLTGSDVAYDVHLRRVFLRTGIADSDDLDHMVAAARAIHPERPGLLDNPAWDIGRRWCRPKNPRCDRCPLLTVCPRLIERGDSVKGI